MGNRARHGARLNVVMALLLGAFVVHGVQPGPMMMQNQKDIFWGIVASMYIGNIMLLILNMPLIGMWVQVLKVPYNILFPLILMFCVVGVFASENKAFDVLVMTVFGVAGYLFRKFGYEPAPLVLAYVLGPRLDTELRKSLTMSAAESAGGFWIFLERKISLVCLVLAAIVLIVPLLPGIKKTRDKVAVDTN